jgi:hypothetical protein
VTTPGGTFLLITTLNHLPTRTEPQSFSWDVLQRFRGFEVIEERRLERGSGIYSDAIQNVPYDESDPTRRFSIEAIAYDLDWTLIGDASIPGDHVVLEHDRLPGASERDPLSH